VRFEYKTYTLVVNIDATR